MYEAEKPYAEHAVKPENATQLASQINEALEEALKITYGTLVKLKGDRGNQTEKEAPSAVGHLGQLFDARSKAQRLNNLLQEVNLNL